MNKSSITVAIITRNRAPLLKKALDSLAAQTRPADEILIIDNASTDDTQKVVEQMAQHFPIQYVFEDKIGISSARNAALTECKGEILAFIDDDAVADPHWLNTIDQTFLRNPQAVAVQGRTDNLFPENLYASLVQFISQDMPKLRDRDGNVVKSPSMICSMNLAFKMNPVKNHGIFFDTSLTRGEDRNFGHQLLRNNMLIIYAEDALNYHHWPQTLKGYIGVRWKAGVARGLLKQKFEKGSFNTETRKWGLAKTLKTAWAATKKRNIFRRLSFLSLLVAGKLISEIAQFRTKDE
ncbi:MAG: glycosyltransferase [Proteobacteria bacterium]|nr:glycosyltransferase [Pseudomonadota bacterium]MBU1710088.1 glycosyltransferase [Pseudomonadota bacterium]